MFSKGINVEEWRGLITSVPPETCVLRVIHSGPNVGAAYLAVLDQGVAEVVTCLKKISKQVTLDKGRVMRSGPAWAKKHRGAYRIVVAIGTVVARVRQAIHPGYEIGDRSRGAKVVKLQTSSRQYPAPVHHAYSRK